MIRILVVALALGLSNFGASIGIGLSGVDRALRRQVIVIFGFFEAFMPIVGLVLGQRLSDKLGSSAHVAGGALLVLVGLYVGGQARRTSLSRERKVHRGRDLIVTGAALSLDNLIVGFALGTTRVPLWLAVVVIAVVSVAMSLVGLEIGRRLGATLEKWSAELGALVLIAVGISTVFAG